ncbi:MAG: TlpA family protein disulfide reductase [Xanthomonadales bacterium]|nr:TlpA family protein disulfide reductase [Gammaproteobacteria bacterium]NNE04689.1 TlpA family protein disulfide reductase [Xanthomonadales bacterium]NNL95750.1 TlpA family protein disulfide reductase [Xanthomonadales bacterium]
MNLKWTLLIIAGLAGAGGGWLFTETVLRNGTPEPLQAATISSPADLLGTSRPDFSLGTTTGEVLTAADLDGNVVLINFWATWCKPCRAEMPMLARVHEELNGRGFEVLGVAMDDVQQATDFLDELGITYRNAVGTVDVMAMSSVYGNRAGMLPYSVLLDRDGIVRWTELGEVEEHELREQIRPLL